MCLLEWPKLRHTKPNTAEDTEKQALSYITDGEGKWQSLEQRVWQFLTKLKYFLPYGLATTLPQYLSKEFDNLHPCKILQMDVFTEALFLIEQTWKTPKCSFLQVNG